MIVGPPSGTDSLSCNYGAEAGADVFLNAVHAAAENTSTLAHYDRRCVDQYAIGHPEQRPKHLHAAQQ